MSDEKKKEILEQENELDADELDAVAGGGTCICPLAGGGENRPCACVVGGVWQEKDGQGDPERCACAFAGYGI